MNSPMGQNVNSKAIQLSMVLALFSGYLIYSSIEKMDEDQKKAFGIEVTIIRASRDIKEQETLTSAMFDKVSLPKKFQEPSAIVLSKTDEKANQEILHSLEGTVALVPIKKGEQVTYHKITEPGIRTGLSPQIAPGKRAVALPVNEVTGVAKLVKPGDRVDVIAIIDSGVGFGRATKVAKTILQDVVVLSVGRNVTSNEARIKEYDPNTGRVTVRPLSEDASFASVTVEVEPAQAQLISLITANSDNVINLSLRNNDDQEPVSLPPGTRMSDLIGAPSQNSMPNQHERVPARNQP